MNNQKILGDSFSLGKLWKDFLPPISIIEIINLKPFKHDPILSLYSVKLFQFAEEVLVKIKDAILKNDSSVLKQNFSEYLENWLKSEESKNLIFEEMNELNVQELSGVNLNYSTFIKQGLSTYIWLLIHTYAELSSKFIANYLIILKKGGYYDLEGCPYINQADADTFYEENLIKHIESAEDYYKYLKKNYAPLVECFSGYIEIVNNLKESNLKESKQDLSDILESEFAFQLSKNESFTVFVYGRRYPSPKECFKFDEVFGEKAIALKTLFDEILKSQREIKSCFSSMYTLSYEQLKQYTSRINRALSRHLKIKGKAKKFFSPCNTNQIKVNCKIDRPLAK